MRFIYILVISMLSFAGIAQSNTIVQPADLQLLAGCWAGALSYLDYGSNKKVSIPVACKVHSLKSSRLIVLDMSFPNEPHANSKDTIIISGDGQFLDSRRVVRKMQPAVDSILIVTEADAVDGNENRKAMIRYQYSFSKLYWQIKKEVMFDGENEWILRNTFSFEKTADCR